MILGSEVAQQLKYVTLALILPLLSLIPAFCKKESLERGQFSSANQTSFLNNVALFQRKLCSTLEKMMMGAY